jgi:hypothetical protein
MTFFKRAFTTAIKPTTFKSVIDGADKKLDTVIKRFVSDPSYSTQIEVYSACYNHPWPSKIILNNKLYDSFEISINKYGEKTSPRLFFEACMIIPTTIYAFSLSQPFDIFDAVLFGGCLMVEYEIVAIYGRIERDVHNRQIFLQNFLNSRIEKSKSILNSIETHSEIIEDG